MNATMDHIKEDVLFAAAQEFQMHITAKSVLCRKKIETDAQRLLILAVQKLICFTNGRNMVSKNDSLKENLFSKLFRLRFNYTASFSF